MARYRLDNGNRFIYNAGIMRQNGYKQTVKKLLASADVTIDGDNPWDIQVHNEGFYRRVLSQGALGLGESYMDAWWDAKELDQFFHKILCARINKKVKGLPILMTILKAKFFNLQSKSRSNKVAQQHYDIGNDLYRLMLDNRMNYTCGYWKDAENLDEAQEAKLDLVCKKIKLKKGDSVLELGSGFGGFARYAAMEYGAEVTCYNISKEQVAYARSISKGLPITIHHQDYRFAQGMYDKVVSIGLCEHVGYKNYDDFFELVSGHLKEEGLFLLHTIGGNYSTTSGDPWSDKYIFPNGMLPSIRQLATAMEKRFVMEDWHNFGPDYYKTAKTWFENFDSNWEKIKENKKYNDRFYRMWKYYLLSAGTDFKTRNHQLWQIILSKKGVPGGYESVR